MNSTNCFATFLIPLLRKATVSIPSFSSITTPLWLVQSKDDKTVSYTEAAERVYNLLKDKGAILTAYDNVTVDGTTYDGHSAWIYTARNMPEHDGQTVFQWAAEQKLTN